MKTRIAAILCAVTMLVSGHGFSAPAGETLPAAALKGEPTVKAGAAKGIFVWADAAGVHVRWSSDGKPALFTGTIELSKPVGKIVRVNTLAGGWVQVYAERVLMFSATARDALDGFDAAIPSGASAKLDLQIDGQPADMSLVAFGSAQAHVKEFPVHFTCP